MYDLLREAQEERPNVSYSVRCQFLEIYGEDIHDLLEPAGSTVTIREGQNGEVNVHGAKEMLVHGAEVRYGCQDNITVQLRASGVPWCDVVCEKKLQLRACDETKKDVTFRCVV